MKRFFFLTLMALLLCGHVSHAQNKTAQTQEPSVASSTEKSSNGTENPANNPQNEDKEGNPNSVPPIDIPGQEISVDERTISIAEKANNWAMWQTIIGGFGLLFVIAATVFAGGAWVASNTAVKVAKVDAMPNLHVRNFKHSAVIHQQAGVLKAYQLRDKVICSVDFVVENRGRTAAKNVIIHMQAKIVANDTREIVEEISVRGFKKKEVSDPAPSDTTIQCLSDLPASDEIPVRHGFLLPFGEAIKFDDITVVGFHIYRIEIDVTFKYQTDFGDNVTINQVFGIHTLKEDGIVERITRSQKYS